MGFLDFSSTKAGFHTLVRIATLIFAICAIIFPWILVDRYHHAKVSITNTTTPCFDADGTTDPDKCQSKGVPLADRFRAGVTANFKNDAIFGRKEDANTVGLFETDTDSLFYKQCRTSGKWTATNKLCLGAGAWEISGSLLGEDGSGNVVSCVMPSDPATIDFNTHMEGQMVSTTCVTGGSSVSFAECGIQCNPGSNPANQITKMTVEFFLKNAKLNGKTFDENLDAYIDEYMQPLPFDGKAHAEPYKAVQQLYRNMDEFSITKNLSIGELSNIEASNPKIRALVHEVSDVSQNYYLFLQMGINLYVIAALATAAPILIVISEWNQMRQTPSPFIQSSFFHWLYTVCYFVSAFLAIVYFTIAVSSDFHMPLFRSLDDLMVDASTTTTTYGDTPGSNDITNNGDTADYRSYLWEDFDQPSLLHRLRVIAFWWHMTFYFVVLSLTAHLSLKMGPLANLLKKEVDSFSTAAKATAHQVASKVPTAVKYLPLVSVVRT